MQTVWLVLLFVGCVLAEGLVGPGGKCLDSTVCIPEAECSPLKVCECKKGTYVQVDTQCKSATAQLGGDCEHTLQCQVHLGDADCIGGKCNCSHVVENNVCIAPIGLGEKCTLSQSCQAKVPGSICAENICSCTRDYVPNKGNNKCLARANYLQPCEDNRQCEIQQDNRLLCLPTESSISKICRCSNEYHFNQTIEKCLFSKGIGQECDRPEFECHLPDDGQEQHIVCGSDKKCQCLEGYRPSDDNRRCSGASTIAASLLSMLLTWILLHSK